MVISRGRFDQLPGLGVSMVRLLQRRCLPQSRILSDLSCFHKHPTVSPASLYPNRRHLSLSTRIHANRHGNSIQCSTARSCGIDHVALEASMKERMCGLQL